VRARCPSCAAIYDLPAAMLSEGRALRCGLCATEWRAAAAEPEPAPADEPVPPVAVDVDVDLAGAAVQPIIAPFQPTDHDRQGEAGMPAASRTADPAPEPLAAPPSARSRWLPALLGWAGSLVFLISAVGTAIGRRETLMHAWPPSQRLFHWLGLV
jgi:predicted Zn finger-like uncharacterized protein